MSKEPLMSSDVFSEGEAAMFIYACVAIDDIIVAEYAAQDEGADLKKNKGTTAQLQNMAKSYLRFVKGSGAKFYNTDHLSIFCDSSTFTALGGRMCKFLLIAEDLHYKEIGTSVLDFLKVKFKETLEELRQTHPKIVKKLCFQSEMEPVLTAMFENTRYSFNGQLLRQANASGSNLSKVQQGLREIEQYTEKRMRSSTELVKEAQSMKEKAANFKIKAKKLKWIGYWKWILTAVVCGVIILSLVAAGIASAVKKHKEKQIENYGGESQPILAQQSPQAVQASQAPAATNTLNVPRPKRVYYI